MHIALNQLAAHLHKGLRPLYTLHGDEPLLLQEAADAIRAHGPRPGLHRAQQLHRGRRAFRLECGAGGRWQPEPVRRPADRRDPHPLGQAGQGRQRRAAADRAGRGRQRQHAHAGAAAAPGQGHAGRAPGSRRSRTTARPCRSTRSSAPRCRSGSPSAWPPRASAWRRARRASARCTFFADRVEGNLLAAHQEIQKLALLHPPGELGWAQVEAAVLNVARYDVFKLSEAVLAGQLLRVQRMLDGLQAEGEAAVLVHWALAEDIRAPQARQRRHERGPPPADGAARKPHLGREGAPLRTGAGAPDRRAARRACCSPRTWSTASSRASRCPTGRRTRGRPCSGWRCSWAAPARARPGAHKAHAAALARCAAAIGRRRAQR